MNHPLTDILSLGGSDVLEDIIYDFPVCGEVFSAYSYDSAVGGQRRVLNEHKLGVSQHYTRPKMILSIGDGELLSVVLVDSVVERSDIIHKNWRY